jgi:hypothetical protein
MRRWSIRAVKTMPPAWVIELLEGRPVLSTLKEVGRLLTSYLAATEPTS